MTQDRAEFEKYWVSVEQAAKATSATPGDYTEGRKRLHEYLDENHGVIPLTDDLAEIEHIVLSYAGRASEAAQQAEAEPVAWIDPNLLRQLVARNAGRAIVASEHLADQGYTEPLYAISPVSAPVVPEGYALVPKEPNEDMLCVDTEVAGNSPWHGDVEITELRLRRMWADMLSAAQEGE